jgi:hypothetical protein
VGDVVVVGEAECRGDLAGDLGGLFGRELLVGREDLGERSTLHLLHDDEVGALELAPVVDVDDVRVRQAGGRLRLTAEPLDEVGVGGELGEQHLDRDLAVEQEVARGEHVGHAAASDPFVDLVTVVDDRRFAVVRHVVPSAPEHPFTALGKVTDPSFDRAGRAITTKVTGRLPGRCPAGRVAPPGR